MLRNINLSLLLLTLSACSSTQYRWEHNDPVMSTHLFFRYDIAVCKHEWAKKYAPYDRPNIQPEMGFQYVDKKEFIDSLADDLKADQATRKSAIELCLLQKGWTPTDTGYDHE